VITFDFDDVQHWGPRLTACVSALVPLTSAADAIRKRKPEFVEEASEVFFRVVYPDKAAFNSAVSGWIRDQSVVAYHGSRLDAQDRAAITENGLGTLCAEHRRECLRKKLCFHPQWSETLLDAALEKLGPKRVAGNREGQVHATISRGGLVNGFPHYLTHGSEFDQRAAKLLFGDDGMELLARFGTPVLIKLVVPGEEALAAANPYWHRSDPQESPNLVREIIQVWAYWLANPDFEVGKLQYDCGLIFNHDIPPGWIISIDKVADR
jgi:hypothetical protein